MKIIIKKRYFFQVLFTIGLVIFVLSNAYFGWNKTAQSNWENVFDIIWSFFVIVGLLGMFVEQIIIDFFKNNVEIE